MKLVGGLLLALTSIPKFQNTFLHNAQRKYTFVALVEAKSVVQQNHDFIVHFAPPLAQQNCDFVVLLDLRKSAQRNYNFVVHVGVN